MKIVVQKSSAYRSLAIFYMSPLLLNSNANQYNINGLLCTYTEMFCIQTCCNQESRNFCQFYLVLSLFYSLQRGSNGFIAEKTILILYQGSRWVHYFPEGGTWPTFSREQMLISIRTHIRTCYFPGGGRVRTPYPPLDPHMGNVIITGQYLSQSRF